MHWSVESPMELFAARTESRLALMSAANDLKNDGGRALRFRASDVDSLLEADTLEPSLESEETEETEHLRLASSAAGGSAISFICMDMVDV